MRFKGLSGPVTSSFLELLLAAILKGALGGGKGTNPEPIILLTLKHY